MLSCSDFYDYEVMRAVPGFMNEGSVRDAKVKAKVFFLDYVVFECVNINIIAISVCGFLQWFFLRKRNGHR